MAKSKPGRVSEADLTYDVLAVIMAQPTKGQISTTRLIAELRTCVKLSPEDQAALENRSDDRFSQIVRNIKSHKKVPGNLIYEGYLKEIKGGFEITEAGRKRFQRGP